MTPSTMTPFPRGFLRGGPTAANQPEGVCDEGGKGLSIAWSRIFPKGDDAMPNAEGAVGGRVTPV